MRGCGLFVVVMAAGAAVGQPDEPFPAVFRMTSINGITGFAINGFDEESLTGVRVASAGDVNGDGFDDVIVGAPFASPAGRMWAGQCYVVFGGPDVGASGPIELATLNGANGFAINGISADDRVGYELSHAGDVNGDGFDDIIVGSTNAVLPPARVRAGQSYVIFGAQDVGVAGVVELAALDGQTGFVLNGVDRSDLSGSSVASAGDVNDDGFDDLSIGAWGASPNGRGLAGEIYVVLGRGDLGGDGAVELSSLDGTNGFAVNGIGLSDYLGLDHALTPAGDLNDDGIADFLTRSVPEGYVLFGGNALGGTGTIELSGLDGSNGFVIRENEDDFDNLGGGLSSAGDLNGDGIDDLLSGRGFIVFGGEGVGASGTIRLSSIDNASGIRISAAGIAPQVAGSVAHLGDLNNDGQSDVIIGMNDVAADGRAMAGQAFVIFGGPDIGSNGVVDGTLFLWGLDGADGFALYGISEGDRLGGSVSSAGDMNGDGITDLIVGASGTDPNGVSRAGRAYVVFGRDLSPCLADTDGDGVVSPADYNAWILAFNGQSPACDQNGDGLCTPADYNAWILNYNAGC